MQRVPSWCKLPLSLGGGCSALELEGISGNFQTSSVSQTEDCLLVPNAHREGCEVSCKLGLLIQNPLAGKSKTREKNPIIMLPN